MKAKDENFMANNEIKTNAEIYREQRKARLAKAAKKKKSGKGDKIARILVKVLCILLVVGIVLYCVTKLLTDVLYVPQKALNSATYVSDDKTEYDISIAEFNYYYIALYNQAASVSQQYDSEYGQGAGAQYYFDTTVSPSEQEYIGEDVPESVVTWADFFRYSAPIRATLIKELYAEATSEQAKKDGFEITDEQKREMNETIESTISQLAENAKTSNYSLNNYIAKVCGQGVTEELYRELLERDTVAEYYLTWYETKLQNDISDEDIENYYNEHKADFDRISLRFFKVSYAKATDATSKDPVYTKEEAQKRADKFLAEVKSEADFIAAAKEYAAPSVAESFKNDDATLDETVTKTAATQLSEEFAEWAFDGTRKANDVKVFDFADQEAYCVVYIVETAHRDTSVTSADVCHLLKQAETSTTNAEGATVELSEDEQKENFANAKAEADKLLKEWKDGDATLESFKALVKEHTDDTASAETGGLYEDINAESSYVPEFLEWSLADHKKGDTGIVKTDYGYHIMYYVGGDTTPRWKSDVKTAISTNAYNEYFDALYLKITESVQINDTLADWAADRLERMIDNNIAYSAANSSSSYTY